MWKFPCGGRGGFVPSLKETTSMKTGLIAKCLLACSAVILMSGCLTQETVTSNGEVISQDYVIKRPLKDVIENSQQQ